MFHSEPCISNLGRLTSGVTKRVNVGTYPTKPDTLVMREGVEAAALTVDIDMEGFGAVRLADPKREVYLAAHEEKCRRSVHSIEDATLFGLHNCGDHQKLVFRDDNMKVYPLSLRALPTKTEAGGWGFTGNARGRGPRSALDGPTKVGITNL